MKEVLDVNLPDVGQPFSWAVRANGVIFTSAGPVRDDGTIDTGPIEDQARLTFQNLQKAMEAGGGTLADVAQVLIYMTDVKDMKVIDGIYREFFTAPYPSRSSAAVQLVVPGMKIELVAFGAPAAQ